MNGFSGLVYTSDPCCGDKLFLDNASFLLVTCCDFDPEITLHVRLMGKKIAKKLLVSYWLIFSA